MPKTFSRTTLPNRSAYQLAAELLTLCRQKTIGIATAESCTGGRIAAALTSVPGASSVYLGGWVVYTSEFKSYALGVKKKTLELYGDISKQVASEMAQRAQTRATSATSDKKREVLALAITGEAGPLVSDPRFKPGCGWIGLAYRGQVWTQKLALPNQSNRARIQRKFTEVVLAVAIDWLEGKSKVRPRARS